MSIGNSGFFDFLNNLNPYAARSANQVGELIFTYPSSAIVKAGVFIEDIVNDVLKIEKIDERRFENLASKISHLYRQGYIKKELFNSFSLIRRKRNEAAHDSSNHSLSAALVTHEELYKVAVWYYESYGDATSKIPLYEIPKYKSPHIISEVMEEKIREKFSKVLEDVARSTFIDKGGGILEKSPKLERKLDESKEQQENEFNTNETSLITELTRLRDSSQEAIENASYFGDFKKYLHVNRQVQTDFEEILREDHGIASSKLILLCGSVGDGKSHLLAYLNESHPVLTRKYKIINDATESVSPTMDAMESLEEKLKSFSDQLINKSNKKIVLAINMGVLHNFINRQHKVYTYNKFKEFIESSELFTEKITTTFHQGCFSLISFGDYHYYELTKDGATSSFYESLLDKVVNPSMDNPFYSAFLRDKNKGKYSIIHKNYEFLQERTVRKQIVKLIIEVIIKHKLVISARAFLNFIADIIIPVDTVNTNGNSDQLNNLLPNLLFNRSERSEILRLIKQSDPIHVRLEEIDKIHVKINTYEKFEDLADEHGLSKSISEILLSYLSNTEKNKSVYFKGIKTLIRVLFLNNKVFTKKMLDRTVEDYLYYLYHFNIGNADYIKGLYEMVKICINLWQGHIMGGYTFIKRGAKFSIAQKLNFRPEIKHLEKKEDAVLKSFRHTLQLLYKDDVNNSLIELDIDYPLFDLLNKVKNGYIPNKKDEEDAVKFVEFIENMMRIGQKKDEILIRNMEDKRNYLLKRDDFGGYAFEKR